MHRRLAWQLFISIVALVMAQVSTPVWAQTCTREQLTAVIDASDEALRKLNLEASPRLQSKILKLKEKKGWPDDDAEAKAYEYLEDERIRTLDDQSKLLLARIDELGDDKAGDPTCTRIADLQAAFSELKATVQAKINTQIAKLDKELAGDAPATVASAPAEPNPGAPPLRPALREANNSPPPAIAKAPEGKPATAPPASWSAQTRAATPPPAAGQVQPQASVATLPPPPAPATDATYSIEEVRQAGSGFFGTASSELAAVLNYAFQKIGQPNAYILGDEGGGAFIAGLRFGKGVLHTKSGFEQKVFWRGPSIGYDFGAEGARTMYLVYKLANPDDLFATYTGIDGSAYLVGGVGITFLKRGDVILAPIRTGIGLRLGANIGYLKFTPKQSWSPF